MSDVVSRQPSSSAAQVWVLVATITASSLTMVASTVLNLASLPLQTELGASGVDLLWIINSFTLILAALILLGGSLGDHYGRKRMLSLGVGLFGIGSIVGGVANSVSVLMVGRVLQGVGGALAVPGSLAVLSAAFSAEKRGQAIGTWSSIGAIAGVIGPILGGFLVDQGWWRGLFFMNIPFVLLTLYALRFTPESRDEEAPAQLDILGAVLITISLGALTYGALEFGRGAAASTTLALGAIVLGVVTLIGFVLVELRVTYPLVKPTLFRSRTFTGTNLMTLMLYAGLAGALFFLPINLTQIQHYPATLAGAAFLPTTVLIALISPYAGRLSSRIGARPLLVAGPLVVGVAFFMLAIPGVTSGPADYWLTFFPVSVVIGVGLGLTIAPLTTAVMNALSTHEAGVASGVNNAVARAAQVLAVAIMGAALLSIFGNTLNTRLTNTALPAAAQQQLMAQASSLGNIPLPTTLSAAQTTQAQQAISLSFVEAFRYIVIAAGALAWISAALAAFFVEPTKRQ